MLEGPPSPGLRLRRVAGLSPKRGGSAFVTPGALMLNLVSARGLPVYSTFFLWSFGTGANQLARPLFAASFGVPLALVALVTSSNSLSHLLAGPVTGYAMDRWGRKPLLIVGLVLRRATLILEFYATSYPQYLAL